MNESIVEIRDVSFSYNGQVVLEDVNLEVRPNDFIALIGPNGGGKTTLLKLMLGLLQPVKGSIQVFGKPAQKMSRKIGYVPQDVHINPGFPITAEDVVLMGTLDSKRSWAKHTSKNRRKALEALEYMELADVASSKMTELSGGQRQRALIARALVTEPELLLLDEPTANIDTKGQADFYRLLQAVNDEITVLVVSHDMIAVSRYIKSVACVNKHLHYHNQAEITGDMMELMYPSTLGEECPVELLAHGLPHRVYKDH